MSQKIKFALVGIVSLSLTSLYFLYSNNNENEQYISQRKEISLDDIHRVKDKVITANEKLEVFIETNGKKHQNLTDEQKVALLKEKIAELYPDDNIDDLGEAEVVMANSVKIDSHSNVNNLIKDQKAGLQALEDQDSTEILDWK